MIFRKLSLCFILMFMTACAGAKLFPHDLEKSEVVEKVHSAAPSACAYAGRVRLRYLDEWGQTRASSVVNKSCGGDMAIKVLGLFGMVAAEIGVKEGNYIVIRKGEDVTGDFAFAVTAEDVAVMRRAMTLPPELPDEGFDMMAYSGGWIFTHGELSIHIDSEYRVGAVVKPRHSVEYRWDGSTPASITVSRTDMLLELTFRDKWVLD